ncbi:hypothetical protein [Methanobrevibacter sp. V74]|uniref:hypothetical protein n=1 Tax=Methanobrevibacter sp. V74 TaxID=3064279 RepID=UPI0027356AFA|nr:hypothetical protein [Methanobrevibacter sp. V74]
MTYKITEDIYYTNFINSKDFSKSSKANYYKTLRKFTQALNTTLEDIVNNCKNQQSIVTEKIISHGTDEEGNQIIEKRITKFDINSPNSLIKKYFDGYIDFCRNRGNTTNTIVADLDHIKTFLKYYSVQYPKTNMKRTPSKWNLLEKEDIKFVMEDSFIVHKTLISTLKDSGLRLTDALQLDIGMFMQGTIDYHNFVDVDEFIDNAPEDMICILELTPHKTKRFNVSCITGIGPETCNLIIQNLRKIKNEYLPYINKKKGLDLKMSKSDSLFGNKRKYFKGPMQVQSVADVFTRKNRKLRKWRIAKIDEVIKNGEISSEDREKEIEKIPKFHAHALRKFFQTTIARNCGNLRICTLMEGHTSPLKTDDSYIKLDVAEIKEAYLSAIEDLSLENTEVKVYTSEIRKEMEEKITTLEKEVKEKEAQAENMEERLSKIESLFNDVDKLSDDDIFNLFARKK